MAKASYHHGNLREALIRVAVDQIEEGGVDGFSLARVCRTVGVTHAAAYKHFADRTALLHAVSDEAMREFGRALTAAMAPGATPREQYLASGRAVVSFARARPHLYSLAFGSTRRDDTTSLSSPPPGTVLHDFVGMISQWQAAGWLREGDPTEWALVLWASAHGLALLVATGRLAVTAEQADALVDGLMLHIHEGLGA